MLNWRIQHKRDGSPYVQIQSTWHDVCVDMNPDETPLEACRRWLVANMRGARGCNSLYGCVADAAVKIQADYARAAQITLLSNLSSSCGSFEHYGPIDDAEKVR